MADLPMLHAALCQSIELWGKGQHSEALKLLDEWIAKARRENQTAWIKPLCMQASLIAEAMGELHLVRQYSEQILSHQPGTVLQKALALYNLADALFRQGETDAARRCAAECFALVSDPNNQEEGGLLELLLKSWPEVIEWAR